MQSQFVQLKETEHLQCSVSHLFMESLQDKERSTKRQVIYTKGQERLLQAELCHCYKQSPGKWTIMTLREPSL